MESIGKKSWAVLLLLVGGCEGDPDLDGTWFYRSQASGAMVYSGEHVIVQDGNRVLIRACRGDVTELVREGDSLLYPNGLPYHLGVADNTTLTGPGDAGEISTAVKLYPRIRFADGSLRVVSPIVGELVAVDDVCAMSGFTRFGRAGTDLLAPTVTVTAPYGRTYVRVEMSFRDITSGVHPFLPHEEFITGAGSGFTGTIESTEFQPLIGNDVLPVVSGSIEITDARHATFQFHGTLQLASGETLTLSASVDLGQPAH